LQKQTKMEQTIIITTATLTGILFYRIAKSLFFPSYRIIETNRYSFIGKQKLYYAQKTDLIGWENLYSIGHDTIDEAQQCLEHHKKNKKQKSKVIHKY
jgi:hypothetical protein